MTAQTARQTPAERPIVTDHAKLRFRQRVDARAGNVTGRLEEMFRRGERVSTPATDGPTRQYGDYYIVYRVGERPVIVSVFYATEGGS